MEQPLREIKGRNSHLLFRRQKVQEGRTHRRPRRIMGRQTVEEERNLLPRRQDAGTPGTKEVKEDRGIPERPEGVRICRESFLASAEREEVPEKGINVDSLRSSESRYRSRRMKDVMSASTPTMSLCMLRKMELFVGDIQE